MKRVLLTRHAEAASIKGIDDFYRPLTTHGITQAKDLATQLQKHHLIPEVWISSTALRAQATAHILADALSVSVEHSDRNIYEASEQALLSILNKCSNEYKFVALTGHNPGISYLFYNLCNQVREIPPCTALLIEFELDNWQLLSANMGLLKWYYAPH